jgi:hypothetical protein
VDLDPSWKQSLLYAGGHTGGSVTQQGGTIVDNEDTYNNTGGTGGTQPSVGGNTTNGDALPPPDVSKDTVITGGRDAIDTSVITGGSVTTGGTFLTGGGISSGGNQGTGGNMNTGGTSTGGISSGGVVMGGSMDAGRDADPDVPNGTGGSNWPSGWSVQDITNDEDVSLAGTLVRAANLAGASDVTINGVSFKTYQLPTSPYTLPNGDVVTPSDTQKVNSYDGFGAKSDPFTRLSTAYQALLQRGFYNDGSLSTASSSAQYTLTVNGLTAGRAYLLQMWVNDSRASNLNQSNALLYATLSDGVNNIVLRQNKAGQAGGTGQYAIVVFEATGSSKSFTLTGGNESTASTALASSLMMAYQVRAK